MFNHNRDKLIFNQDNLDNFNNQQPKPEIIPAILPESFDHLEREVDFVRSAIKITAGFVQVDVVDGNFAPSTTWPFNQKDSDKWQLLKNQKIGLPNWDQVSYEIDLMVMDQLSVATEWINAGVSRIIGHIESFDKNYKTGMTLPEYTKLSKQPEYFPDLNFEDIQKFIDLKNQHQVELVMSLNPSTQSKTLFPLLDQLDAVQFMGNDRIGYHGVDLDESILPKIKDLRSMKPELPIGVDIGVNFDTLEVLRKSGVTRFSSGSTILKSKKPRQTIAQMLEKIYI